MNHRSIHTQKTLFPTQFDLDDLFHPHFVMSTSGQTNSEEIRLLLSKAFYYCFKCPSDIIMIAYRKYIFHLNSFYFFLGLLCKSFFYLILQHERMKRNLLQKINHILTMLHHQESRKKRKRDTRTAPHRCEKMQIANNKMIQRKRNVQTIEKSTEQW